MNVKELLEKEVKSQIEALEDIEYGSETFKVGIDGTVKLLDKLTDMDRLDLEYQDKYENRVNEQDLKLKQIEEERKDHIVKNGLTVLGLIVTTGVTIWGVYKTLEFEETGTITTSAGRAFINKLFSKK